MTTTTAQRDDWQKLQDIGGNAHSVIAEMVEAAQCDFDRLEELRDTPAAELDEDEREELQELAEAAGDCQDEDEALQRIQEDPLSVQVRSDWQSPGGELEPSEFDILLSTGGPATRIVGDLDEHRQPTSARLESQDWFQPWTAYSDSDSDILVAYASHFYFGE